MTLTNPQARAAIRLLRVLQTHLESAIETSVIGGKLDGEPDPRDKAAVHSVRLDRRDRRAAEHLIIKLEAGLKG